jgi:Zn-dependent protease with chaperone function
MILTSLLVAIVGFTLPHALRLRRAAPLTAAVIWTTALSLRALTVVLAVGWLLLFFPSTHLFAALTHWCWHHLASAALNGHDVGHATTVAPALVGLASLASLAVATIKLGRALRRHIATSRAGGPAGSIVIGGQDVVVAVVGLRRQRLVVSAGALLELEDDELAAALAHERAHIRRRHRFILIYAGLCGAIARVLPETRTALDELAFHLERDADRAALAGAADREALAGALRKASRAPRRANRLVVALGGSRVEERVREILEGPRKCSDRSARLCTTAAAALVALLLGVAASTPPALARADHGHSAAHDNIECDEPRRHGDQAAHAHG